MALVWSELMVFLRTGLAVLLKKCHFLKFDAEELLVQRCESFVLAGMD